MIGDLAANGSAIKAITTKQRIEGLGGLNGLRGAEWITQAQLRSARLFARIGWRLYAVNDHAPYKIGAHCNKPDDDARSLGRDIDGDIGEAASCEQVLNGLSQLLDIESGPRLEWDGGFEFSASKRLLPGLELNGRRDAAALVLQRIFKEQ